jgi:hypothetical protein
MEAKRLEGSSDSPRRMAVRTHAGTLLWRGGSTITDWRLARGSMAGVSSVPGSRSEGFGWGWDEARRAATSDMRSGSKGRTP